MNEQQTAGGTVRRAGSGAGRLVRAWRSLPPERRLAAYAALGLFLALFLPWYQRHFFVIVSGKAQPASDSQTGWAAFSFVEAAVLLVSAGVLTLLFQRAEGRAFHVPGGDGGVITAAGVWTCILVIWRIFDKQSAASNGAQVTTSGIEWGIFIALAIAATLAYAGSRIRAAHQPEPPLPGERAPVNEPSPPVDAVGAPRRARQPRPVPADPPQPGAEDQAGGERFGPPVLPDDPPTMRIGEPSTQSARRRTLASDEQLTMPLDTEDREQT